MWKEQLLYFMSVEEIKMIKKKLVEGYCPKCGEHKQGYVNSYRVFVRLFIDLILYFVACNLMPNAIRGLAQLFVLVVVLEVCYKVYTCFKNKKRCFVCGSELM